MSPLLQDTAQGLRISETFAIQVAVAVVVAVEIDAAVNRKLFNKKQLGHLYINGFPIQIIRQRRPPQSQSQPQSESRLQPQSHWFQKYPIHNKEKTYYLNKF